MLRVISDIHEKGDIYKSLIKDVEASVQLGDLGFNYSFMEDVDPAKHKVFGGNHDNYDLIGSLPHNLGDSGLVTHGGVTFFFVRGANTIDSPGRIPGVSIWPEREQLGYQESNLALEQYDQARPSIMITHDCPTYPASAMGLPPNHTRKLLWEMFGIHQPKIWVFGHHHRMIDMKKSGCRFMGLPKEGGYLDIN